MSDCKFKDEKMKIEVYDVNEIKEEIVEGVAELSKQGTNIEVVWNFHNLK